MSRRPARCTKAEIRRALEVAGERGAVAVDIRPDGTIRLVPADMIAREQGLPAGKEPGVNEWDA